MCRPVVLDAAVVTAGRNLEIVAKRGSVFIVGARATAGKKAEITARDQILADWANVVAGVEIDLIADEILGTPLLNAPKIRIKTT
jgi:hypothetical protein